MALINLSYFKYLYFPDRDECNETNGIIHNCHKDAVCQNSIGSFSCTCKVGYRTVQGAAKGTDCEGTCMVKYLSRNAFE